MSRIPVVQNPRRRRRTLTAKQKAAGFGGKSNMRRKRKTTRRRRRNPGLATLAANPRRRRRSYRAPARRKTYRRRRNPGLGGMMGLVNMPLILAVTGGLVTAHMAPGLLRRFWTTAPTEGLTGTAIRIGSAVIVGLGVKAVFRSNQLAVGVVAGAIGYEVFNFIQGYIPGLGTYVTNDEMAQLSEYVQGDVGFSGYEANPGYGGAYAGGMAQYGAPMVMAS